MHAETDELAIVVMNSGTLLNRHPSTVDTHGITDNPNCPSIYFNTLATQYLMTLIHS